VDGYGNPVLGSIDSELRTQNSELRTHRRPVRESNPSRLFDRQAGTPAPSQGKQSAWRESNPPIHLGKVVPGPLGHRRIGNTNSKGGRSRTLCVRVGTALLSQEHALDGQRKGQDSNLQGLAPRPASNRVPSCQLACPSVSSCPGRGRTCNRLVNNQPHHRCATGQKDESGWPDLNRRSPAPQAGGLPGFPTS
jgi:hypothetical protein